MSLEEKIEYDLMIGLIEDELEERKTKTDRRQKDCEETMKALSGQDRRQNEDRRSA